jgi:hypothetical protein
MFEFDENNFTPGDTENRIGDSDVPGAFEIPANYIVRGSVFYTKTLQFTFVVKYP